MFRCGVALLAAATLLSGCMTQGAGSEYAAVVQKIGPPKPGQSRVVVLQEKRQGLSVSVCACDMKLAPASGIALTSRIDPRLNELRGPLSQTVYRVIQEGLTNALRHAGASSIEVKAALGEAAVTIEVSDDGIGFTDVKFGRGLTGMHERVRALSGTFEVLREADKSVVRCRLPASEDAHESQNDRS